MGQGLGRNSPVVLTLGKENYEALIERHGQWMRWRVAQKCPCVKINTGQADIHCDKCGGLGLIYTFQKDRIVSQTIMVFDKSGVIEVDKKYEDCKLVKVYTSKGEVFASAEKKGIFVILNNKKNLVKGSYITVVMTESILKKLDETICEEVEKGIYKIKSLQVEKPNIDGLYYSANCDIEKIDKVIDGNGREYDPYDYRQNNFYIKPFKETIQVQNAITGELEDKEIEIEIKEPVIAKNISYIEPFIFVLLNQNITRSDEKVMQEINGDAILTFPYNCDVALDDVVTVLSGTYTQKNILVRRKEEFDTIPAYFVGEITSIFATQRKYINDVDFVLCGTNKLKWLSKDAPKVGDSYSITYNIYPTYKVVKSIPQIRTSENQRMPKKAVVKLYDTYGEKRGFNKQ